MKLRTVILLAVISLAAACGIVDDAKQKTGVDDPPKPKEVEDAVVDKLHCSGVARQETRTLVRESVEGRDFDDLAVSPTDLGRIVAGAAAANNTSALLWGNVAAATAQPQVRTALNDGWSDLSCGARESETCEDTVSDRRGGELRTSVECEETRATSVRAEFRDGCRLFATQNSGALEVRRDGDLAFDQLAFGSARRVDGELAVEMQSDELRQLELETGEKLTVTGDAGKSCEKTTTIRELVATDRDTEADLAFDATRSSSDTDVRVQTLETPVTFDKPVKCSCPTSGSLQIRHSDPVGLGAPGTLRIDYASGDESCSRASAEILSWPEGCAGNDACGRGIVEDLAGELITASCTGWTGGSRAVD